MKLYTIMLHQGWAIGLCEKLPLGPAAITQLFAVRYKATQVRKQDESGNFLATVDGKPVMEEAHQFHIGPFVPGGGPMSATFFAYGGYESTPGETEAYIDLLGDFAKTPAELDKMLTPELRKLRKQRKKDVKSP